jgi:SAM-dependent methyltransferase
MSAELPQELIQAARRAQAEPGLAETVARHARELDGVALDTRIHPECQMLAHSLRAHQDADLAVSQYFAVALQQYQVVRQLLDRLFGAGAPVRVLDFACGYGRLLRFLVHRFEPSTISAAEIQRDAVDWVAERYGVQAMRSAAEPDDFRPDRRFDLIWAASLFSHLPDGLFGRWLERLAGRLEPGGALCFSVHDEALLPPEIPMPEAGIHYIAGSENADLDPSIYGTTFVTEAYVRRVVTDRLGTTARVHRLPRLLAHEQDVYVLVHEGGPELDRLAGFRRGTRGWLDELEIEDGQLRLAGWAGSLDPVPFDAVEIRLDDTVIRQRTGRATPRVAEVLGHPGLADSGFECEIDLAGREGGYLSLSAVAEDGERALIYAGRLPTT